MAAYGLYTHIASNKFRSMLLLAGLFALVYVLVYAGALDIAVGPRWYSTYEVACNYIKMMIEGETLRAIPYGGVLSYTQVAAEAGSPRGSRAAGNALGSNPIPIVVPCHRVLRSSGALGGYAGGLDRKRWLLELEGAMAPPQAR